LHFQGATIPCLRRFAAGIEERHYGFAQLFIAGATAFHEFRLFAGRKLGRVVIELCDALRIGGFRITARIRIAQFAVTPWKTASLARRYGAKAPLSGRFLVRQAHQRSVARLPGHVWGTSQRTWSRPGPNPKHPDR